MSTTSLRTTTQSAPRPQPDERGWWPDRVRLVLIAALSVIALEGAVFAVSLHGTDDAPPSASLPAPVVSSQHGGDGSCTAGEPFYATHGTDCHELPIVTGKGELGPANTGGPGGGTDWEPAYPGSNVWIPDYQISGRLYVQSPGSRVTPPVGYEKLGQAPNGATLYWLPANLPVEPPVAKQPPGQ